MGKADTRKPGKWEYKFVPGPDGKIDFCSKRFYCSECGTWQTYGRTPFCMFCGSPMEVADEKESRAS